MSLPSPDKEGKGQKMAGEIKELAKFVGIHMRCLSNKQAAAVKYWALAIYNDADYQLNVTVRKSRGGRVKGKK